MIGVEGVGVAGGSISEAGAFAAEFFFAGRFLLASSLPFFDLGFVLLVVEGVGGALPLGGDAP